MPAQEAAALCRWSAPESLARCVKPAQRDYRAATLDAALPGHGWQLAPVIGWGLSQHRDHRPAVTDPQGFSVEWLRVPAGQRSAPFVLDETAVLIHAQGPPQVAEALLVVNGDAPRTRLTSARDQNRTLAFKP